MIVYGDHSRGATLRTTLSTCVDWLSTSATPIERHAYAVAALIAVGQLAQAVADVETGAENPDRGPGERALMILAVRLAAAVGLSSETGFAAGAAWPATLFDPDSIPFDPDAALILREPEGFAHYAVYPETFWRSAKASGLGPKTVVIGLRSIGTTLAAMVAAALSVEVAWTTRPHGHPFDRRATLDPTLLRTLPASGRSIAVVDEGPGLSGSSFGAVADRLEQDGIDSARIVFFPSHANDPGREASPRHLTRWRQARRFVTMVDDLVLQPGRGLTQWVADLTGAPRGELVDIAGGRWRGLRNDHEASWPPADAFGERRKFLLEAERGTFLLRFSGLGQRGLEAFALQQRLADAGFSTHPTGWRHGFTVEPWRSDLRGLDRAGVDRDRVVAHLAGYLAFRAKTCPACGRSGASLSALLDMLVVNASEALGPEAGRAFETWRPGLTALGTELCPVRTDNRLQAWEWAVTADGEILKTDAVDHHAGHDLIGCQDIAWDLAGAAVEFGLDADEAARMARAVAWEAGRTAPPPGLMTFFEAAYAAFQTGACALAAERNGEAEGLRWRAHAERYRATLRRSLRHVPG